MANHVRQQLREAVATAVTGLATTGSKVYQSRLYTLQPTDLPCLLVMSEGDQIEYATIHAPSQQQRSTRIRIEGIARAAANLDDTLDTICKEVEIAIANASSALVKSMTLLGTQLDTEEGDQPIGRATMIFSADLYTVSNAPDVLIG